MEKSLQFKFVITFFLTIFISGYIFAINQSGAWENSSYYSLSVSDNLSTNTTLITASGGDIVGWYFWANDSLGNENTTGVQEFEVGAKAISLALSDDLANGVKWVIRQLPVTNWNATGNQNASETFYNISVSASGTLVDIFIKADGDLTTGVYDIALPNETYAYNTTDATVPLHATYYMTTEFYNDTQNNTIATDLDDEGVSHLKFFLSVPSAQQVGAYANNISIIGIEAGELP